MAERIAVHLVTGGAHSGKSALIARLAASRPAWLGLVNALPDGEAPNLRRLSPGCPCCVGRVVLQVTLVRALRETRATRALVELADAGHAGSLARLLTELPFSLSVAPARGIVLPEDIDIMPSALEF